MTSIFIIPYIIVFFKAFCKAFIQPKMSVGIPLLATAILLAVLSIILIILGTGSIRGFAITLLIGVVLSMLTSLFVTRGLLNMYYPLNPDKPKHYNLKREDDVSELA